MLSRSTAPGCVHLSGRHSTRSRGHDYAEVETPTIGIGAGPDCDGQVLVFHDILDLTFQQPAKFVRRYGDAAAVITHAVQSFRADVMSHQYPSDAESYHLPRETQVALETVLARKRPMGR